MRVLACVSILAATSVAAADHIHMTVDIFMEEGVPTALIDVGYNASEAAYDIDATGRLTHDGDIAAFRLLDDVVTPPIDGWSGGLAITFTTDFYFSTGRLAGGDFQYEITDVAAVSGPPAAVVFGVASHSGGLTIGADSAGADRAARSFTVGAGTHVHGQFQAVSEVGLYDVTVVAWDANGAYADSDPVTFRVNSCLADFNHDGGTDVFDLLAYLDQWFAGEHSADLDGSGGVDVFDLLGFLDAWFVGC